MTPNAHSLSIVIERSPLVRRRIERVLGAATGLERVAAVEHPDEAEPLLATKPSLIACDAQDARRVLGWLAERLPFSHLLVWSTSSSADLARLALAQPRFSHVIGWPGFASMPRAWEVAMVARRLLDPRAKSPSLRDLLGWGATVVEWQPRTSADRDRAVSGIRELSLHAGCPPRLAERVAEAAHELLMNAMYDAPHDSRGQPRYAHDRRQDLVLEPHEVPTLRLATDGMQLALQASDPFGTLQRGHLFEGVARGLEGASADSTPIPSAILDTSRGGAGLGMLKLLAASAVLMADVDHGRRTEVSVFWELDTSPRELRSMPKSIHFFER
ncbi:MAG TPA: hypothetical protein VK420_23105 [Longimicrobium sp.]|nr:hypothetical protein [Longimicrobium sp.]